MSIESTLATWILREVQTVNKNNSKTYPYSELFSMKTVDPNESMTCSLCGSEPTEDDFHVFHLDDKTYCPTCFCSTSRHSSPHSEVTPQTTSQEQSDSEVS